MGQQLVLARAALPALGTHQDVTKGRAALQKCQPSSRGSLQTAQSKQRKLEEIREGTSRVHCQSYCLA
jgi:hypothetical protein